MRPIPSLVLTLSLAAGSVLAAQEVKPNTSEPAPPEANSTRPDEADPQEVLSQIVAGMQRAGKDISERQVSAETVRVQTEVLSGLDLLIRLAEQNPPPDSPPPTPPPNRPPPTPETPPPGQPQGEGSDATGRKAGSDSRRTDQDPQNASDGSGSSPPDTEAPATRRRVIVREIWGHLPPALQRRLISGEDEKPLPRYERLVEKYFESLAEQSAAKRGSSPQK